MSKCTKCGRVAKLLVGPENEPRCGYHAGKAGHSGDKERLTREVLRLRAEVVGLKASLALMQAKAEAK